MTKYKGFKEAEKRIQQAVENGSLVLDLYDLELENIPEAIGQLTQLQRLDLTNNQLDTLPEFIAQLTQLQELYLSGNQLGTLPELLLNCHSYKCLI